MRGVLSNDEIDALRADTPGTSSVVHLNHAGASLPSEATLNAQVNHLRREAQIGGYEAAAEAAEAEHEVYDLIARLIGCERHEVARLEHATAAWNAGFWAVPMARGQRILTANAAYGANAIGFLRAAERRGVTIEVVPDDEHGQVDIAELARRVDDDVALIALTHVPTNGGLINPAAAVGSIARDTNVPYLLDACQSVGQLQVDVHEIGCDLLSGTGRKYLRGPRGTGFLYASDRLIDRLQPDHPDHWGAEWTSPSTFTLHAAAQRFESWEHNHAAWVALGAAVNEALAIGLDRIEATVTTRARSLRTRLRDAGFTVWDMGEHQCGIVTATHPAVDPRTAKAALRGHAVNISVSEPAATLYDATNRGVPDLMRLSVHYLTTEHELDTTMAALERVTA